ncbi:GerMN domain-containing protein [Brachybacterium sp. YJGR34]|uniref:GerMN domain-containing protein n=1 Tax=Brachybacterium sp. YJGR34 TaxID=2059911 RepID=UPI000E0A9991|nr:GerMN domain-containing protein [Brachybacterium sp. YJGR34]
MMPARRQVLRALGVGALLGLGAACARIPTDSPIDTRALGAQAQPGAPYVRALPPPDDATAEEVVSGFVQAGVGSEDDFAVARAYLTEDMSRRWDPEAGITVYSSTQELEIEQVGENRLALIVQAVATVDGEGTRSLMAGPVMREIQVSIEQVEDQWRISGVPDGIFLSEAAFDTLYTPARLYFLDTRDLHLVPDPRWFPLRRGGTPVLEALVSGPATYLADAVRSQVPASSVVASAAITTTADGATQVEVPAAVDQLDPAARERALAQLEASLRSLPSLSGVTLVSDGVEVVLDEDSRVDRPLPGHRPIAAGPTGVISLADPTTQEGAQLVPALAEREVSSPVIAQSGVLAAARNPEGSAVLLASTDGSVPLREAVAGGAFVAPRLDDAGYVWTSTAASAGVLLALSGAGADRDARVDAPWLAGREVRALDVSADATRLIVLTADDGGTRLDLCAVIRDAEGVPSALTEPVPVRTFLTDVTQATWYDEVAVVVLGRDASGERRAQIVDFSSGRELLPALPTGTDRIAGSVVAGTVWAGTRGGELLRGDGEEWTSSEITGRDPSFY